jgi:hypothetical protein
MIRWLCTLVVGAVLSGFAFLLLTGRYIDDGAVLVTVSAGHGLHVGDLFVLAGWAMAIAALVVLATGARLHSS